jgi:hypothetical protein
MKKLYSLLSSVALLFSLPALAAPLAEKAVEPNTKEKEAQPKADADKVSASKEQAISSESPICRGGGG